LFKLTSGVSFRQSLQWRRAVGLKGRVLTLLFTKVVLLSTLFPRQIAAASSGGSIPPGLIAPGTLVLNETKQVITGSATALLIEDVAPWGHDSVHSPSAPIWDADQQALAYLGITYDLVHSNNLPADLSPYKFVLLASTQPTSAYANIAANVGRISTYVSNGGIYVVHAADKGWWDWQSGGGSDWTGYSILPEGTSHVNYITGGSADYSILITQPSHDIIQDASLTEGYFSGW